MEQHTAYPLGDPKTCLICREAKPRSEFYKQARAKDGHNPYCKACSRDKARENARANVERRRLNNARHYWDQTEIQRRNRALKRFNITMVEYQLMLEAQGGLCAICQQKETKVSRNGITWALSVDHDHRCCPDGSSCGACIRGLLCHSCNLAIGKFRDDPALLVAAAIYLESRRLGAVA